MRALASGGGSVLLVAKPAGVTSHDVVERIRSSDIAGQAKVGHTGTLDPFATGLLIVLVGKATRLQRYLMALPKSYSAGVRFGATSDTGDPTGSIELTGRSVDEASIRAALAQLTGVIRQRVPLASAVKVEGERLYRKALRGERVKTPVREVTISRLALVAFDLERGEGELEVDCSSGTYVRQLVADLGELCSAGAYCNALERTAIGPFQLCLADEGRSLSMSQALSFLPELALTREQARAIGHGRALKGQVSQDSDGSAVRLTFDGELIAVAKRHPGKLTPETVLLQI